MSKLIETKEDFWNIVFMLIFLFLFGLGMTTLAVLHRIPYSIQIFDFFILTLSGFRLIRFFTYDKITAFIRNYFEQSKSPAGHTIYELLICPWCTGMWVTLFVAFTYFSIPSSWLFFLMLSLSGLASLVQIIANSILRYAEKAIVEKEILEEKKKNTEDKNLPDKNQNPFK